MHQCVIACALSASLAVLCLCAVLMRDEPCDVSDRPFLSLCLLGTDAKLIRLALAELNWAFYPPQIAVELFVVSIVSIDTPLWRHRSYHGVSSLPLRFDSRARCIVVLNDTAEVSPVFGFWFFHACDRAQGEFVVSGGEAGLAFSGGAWDRFVANASSIGAVIHPPLGYTFVRAKRQNPLEPEREPNLVRNMELWRT